jgi:hypothetical protein
MEKYYYSLDEHNRINHITNNVIDYYKEIELTVEEYNSIRLSETGIVDGKLVYVGKLKEEKDLEISFNKVSRIAELKQMLAETDWKVIVNSELIQAGLTLKYTNLHQERQAWRDEINALEFEIAMLG